MGRTATGRIGKDDFRPCIRWHSVCAVVLFDSGDFDYRGGYSEVKN